MNQVYHFRPPEDPADQFGGTRGDVGGFQQGESDLLYKVEVFDEDGAFVERILAVSVSPAIGYAAFYAAIREYPARAITLRHRASVLSRWTGRAQ